MAWPGHPCLLVAWWVERPHTPLVDSTMPPRLGLAGSAAIRAGPNPRVPEGKGRQPLLNQHAGLVGHLWGPTLPRAQDLGAIAVQPAPQR